MQNIFLKKIASVVLALLFGVSALFVPEREALAESWDSTPLTNLIDGWPQMREINEASGVVIDAENGGILYSLNRDAIRYPASVTKILTALLVIENCDLQETVTMTSAGTQMVAGGSTNAKTVDGEEFTVEQCLYMLLLKSANDIANQLAVHVSGSIEAFAALMNERASALGCTNTHFTNPSGMPDSEHYTTAEDLSRIMSDCLRNETFLKISGTESVTIPPTNKTPESRTYTNHNALIVRGSEYYYEPCISGKTGYTDAAWRTYIGAARKDDRTLIVVLLKGPDKTDFVDAADLFEYGYQNFEKIPVQGGSVNLPAGKTLADTTHEAEPYGDGKVLVRFTCNKLPVGCAMMTEGEYGALFPEEAANSSGTPLLAGGGEALTEIGEISANNGETSANSGETSANSGETSANSGETLANSGEISVNNGEISVNNGGVPAENEDLNGTAMNSANQGTANTQTVKRTNGGEVFFLIFALLAAAALVVGLQLIRRLREGK